MKKLFLLSLIALGTTAYAKEVAQPVEVVEEIIITEEVIIAPVEELVVATTKNNLYIRTGLDVWSQYDSHSIYHEKNGIKVSNGDTKKMGYEFAIENTKNITDNFELGLGVAYQNHAGLKSENRNGVNYEIGKYDSAPLYVVGKYNFTTFENGITPYVKANVGYSFNFNSKDGEIAGVNYSTKIDDGFYYGVGTGMEYNNFTVDIMYQANQAKVKGTVDGATDSHKKSLDYSRVTLGFGYKFSY